MNWQMTTAVLHSNEQHRTENNADTEKGCQKPALRQKSFDAYLLSQKLNVH